MQMLNAQCQKTQKFQKIKKKLSPMLWRIKIITLEAKKVGPINYRSIHTDIVAFRF